MHFNFFKYIAIILLGLITQSCVRPINPGFYSPRFGPRMIQPVPQIGNANVLPSDPNFTQSYHNYRKSKANSRMGALVRIIEFEYDISNSFSLTPRLTTGYDEGEMTGWLTIVIDQYELTYENKEPQIREYVEEVSYESSRSTQGSQQVYNPGNMATVYNSIQEKPTQVVNRSQLYNSAKYILENEDVNLLLRTNTLSFVVHLQNADMNIYPSEDQIRVLKRMIQKYYNNP
ncbi:MAG: hypothetical protein AAGA77_10060 [Bacteroidota bacterium]